MINFILSIVLSFINPYIEDDIFEFKPPEQAVEAEALIKKLGDNDFQTRENAASRLKELDVRACLALAAHNEDPDPEIKFRTRLILRNMRMVLPREGDFPPIWELPNKLRFIEGYERDVAKIYYEKLWNEKQDFKEQEHPESGYRRPEISYGDSEMAKNATVRYLGDLRVNGLNERYAVELIDQMKFNDVKMKHVVRDVRDTFSLPPSCLLTKQVKEGIFWHEMKHPETQVEPIDDEGGPGFPFPFLIPFLNPKK